jgi:hypothetical protein
LRSTVRVTKEKSYVTAGYYQLQLIDDRGVHQGHFGGVDLLAEESVVDHFSANEGEQRVGHATRAVVVVLGVGNEVLRARSIEYLLGKQTPDLDEAHRQLQYQR